MGRFSSFSRRSFGVRNRAPWLTMLGHSFHYFHENDLYTSAAAMSYFGLLTLFPGLLLLVLLSNQLAGGGALMGQMLTRVVQVYPGSADFLRETVRSLSNIGTGIIITCVIVVLWAGSWVFAVIERALNRIWGTTSRAFLRGRVLTLGMIGIAGLLLSINVLATSLLVFLQQLAARIPLRALQSSSLLLTVTSAVWQSVFTLLSIIVTITLFTLVYRFMPNARVSLRDCLPGAVLGGLLWELSKYAFASSLHYFHYDQIYGPVGAVVAVLTWGYFSSLILLFGAQLTAVFHREHPAEPPQPSPADAAIAPLP
jgi:membrane protein